MMMYAKWVMLSALILAAACSEPTPSTNPPSRDQRTGTAADPTADIQPDQVRDVDAGESLLDEVAAAQRVVTYTIGGKRYPRVKYGDETLDWDAEKGPCHDCGAGIGQYHVPGCDVEQCPACAEQAISCRCAYERRPGT